MKWLRVLFMVVAGCLLAALTVAPTYAVPAQTIGCGTVVTVDTTLTQDITGCTGNGLVVGADGITVNLNGHTISGDEVAGGDGIDVIGHPGVTITNGLVVFFDRGLVYSDSDGGVVSSMNASENAATGIVLASSDDAVVERSFTHDNGVNDIAVTSSTGATITQTRAVRCPGEAAILLDGATHTAIVNSTISKSALGIAVVNGSTDNRIVGSSFLQDVEAAVQIQFSDRNVVARNHIAAGGTGITLESSDSSQINGNQILYLNASLCDGCGVGIQVYGNHDTVANNIVIGAPKYGIEVDDFMDAGHSPVVDTVVRNNTVNKAGEGIAVGSGAAGTVLRTRIIGNTVSAAADDGIQLIGPAAGLATSMLMRNVTIRNANYGIEAVVGTIDGGGNRAASNGNRAECLNIVCH